MKRIIVLAVHPDDETLGCGGTLLKLGSLGAELHWLIATTADEAGGYTRTFFEARRQQISEVSAAFSFADVHELGIPAAKAETLPLGEIIGKLKTQLENIQPDTIFLPFFGDIHSDHRVMFAAALSCTKSFRLPSLKRLYMMETLSETEFAPPIPGQTFVTNTFVDISDYLERKLEIFSLYTSETGPHPFPRSFDNIKALATHRGATAGCRYAEGFMLLKELK